MPSERTFLRLSSALIFLALLLLLSPVSWARRPSDLHKQTQQRVPKPFPPPQFIPDHPFDTHHIALDLHFNWALEQAIGTETISLAPLVANLSSIELDAANITFTSVKLASGTSLKYETDPANEKLRITLDHQYQPAQELTLAIAYHTNGPQSKRIGLTGGGLRFIKPTAEDPARPKQIWSQGESEYNHYWFACYDHPNDFFTSELTATVEKPLTVVSNGKLLQTKENQDGTRTFHWSIEQPHASYLSSLVVGEYTPIVSEYEGIPVITNVYPSQLAEGKITSARLREMVQFFSEKTGLKYPYAKYAQTMARDFGGGMENISATTQTDNMIHDARTELDQTSDGLQSHELAHQWFGDYLTSRNWSDIWLNESFATYFQAMWDEHKLGRDDFLYKDVRANQREYFTAWKQGNRRPIVTKNYSNPDAVFDTYAYPRGGAVLHMLRRSLGEENWWRAINYYLHKYAHQPVETEQFRVAIEESTGQSMDSFFDQWLYKMGHPVFRVTQDYDGARRTLKLIVEQRQQLDPESHYPQALFFRIPLDIEIGTGSATRIENILIEPLKEQTFTFKVDTRPLLVSFDYGGTTIKELEFIKTPEELSYQLKNDPDVLGRIWALGEFATRMQGEKAPQKDKEVFASEIARTLEQDKYWGVRVEAAAALASAPGDAARKALLGALKDSRAAVRARAVTSLAASKDATLASVYQQMLTDQSYAVIRAAALALGQTRNPSGFDSLVKLLDAPSWRDTIRASALTGLAALEDKRAVDLAFRYAGAGNQPQVRAAALRLLGKSGKADPRVFPLIAETFKQALDRIDFNLAIAAAEALVSLGDRRGLVLFEEASKGATDLPQIQELINGYQEQLQKSLELPKASAAVGGR